MRFVDTDVLLYNLGTHPAESARAEIARRLLDDGDLCLSVQVLQEFHVQATRTSRSGALSKTRPWR